MHSKAEARATRQAFWAEYAQQMAAHTSARGPRIPWTDYPTGVKDIYFRTEIASDSLRLCIDIQHHDPSIRECYYDQWWELETMLHQRSGAVWTWQRDHPGPGKSQISRISIAQEGLSIYRREDWPAMIAFLERHMLALDDIWADAITVFKDLGA